jgi:hypothetical protein
MSEDPPHSIIDRPHGYRITSMRYKTGLDAVDLDALGPIDRMMQWWGSRNYGDGVDGATPSP